VTEIPEKLASETPAEEPKPIGYLISHQKFWVMNMLTWGLYSIYWSYENFLAVEVAKPKRPRLFAAIHAFFLNLSFYRLQGLVIEAAAKEGKTIKLPRVLLSIAYFISMYCWNFVFKNSDTITWNDLLSIIAQSAIGALILFPLQLKLVEINRDLRPQLLPEKKYGIKEKTFAILGILFILFLAFAVVVAENLPNNSTNFNYQRWHFVNKESTDQWKNKVEKQALIKKFWARFAKEESRMRSSGLGQVSKDKAKSWIEEELQDIDPNIDWDLRSDLEHSPANIFVLTSRFHWGNRPLVDEIISQAPKIDGWKFMSSRPKAPLYLVELMLEQNGFGDLNNFDMECTIGKEHLINVVYKESGLKDSDSLKSSKKALEIIDLLVGQENEDQWVGTLQTENTEKATEKMESCKKFIADFNNLKEKLLSERFSKPLAQMNEEERQSAYDVLSDAFLTYPFDSRRFSKFNEKFCYLTVKKANTFKTPEAIESKIAQLDKALRAEKCACTLGGAFDLEDRFYFDLCVTDINKTVAVLREFSRNNKYGKDAWLEFYDDIWISEWIGMEPDSTNPEMRYPDRLPR